MALKQINLRIFILSLSTICAVAYSDDEEHTKDLRTTLIRSSVLISLLGFILISCLFRYITLNYKVVIPYGVILLTVGMLMGIGMKLYPPLEEYFYINIPPSGLRMTNLSVLIFRMSLLLDIHVFWKSLPQIMIICGPGFLVTSCLVALMMRLMTNFIWDYSSAIVFGISCAVTLPIPVVRELMQYGSKTRHLTVLLQGESLITTAFYVIIFQMIKLNADGYVIRWYQFLFLSLRFVGFGFIAGFGFGSLGNFLMRAYSNDPIHGLIVNVSIPFVIFYIADNVLIGSSVIGVVVAGIMMNKQRSSLPQDVDEFLVCAWEVIFHVINSFVYARISIFLFKEAYDYLDAMQVMHGFIAYLVESICRLSSFLFVVPVLSRIGYGLNFSDMLICVWGGLKSPLGIFMVVDYASEKRADDSKHPLLKVAPILFTFFYLSLLINGSLIHLILQLLGFSDISLSKQLNMSNCMRYLNKKREKYMSVLRMERQMNDCNWDVMAQATQLKHPYKKIVGSNSVENEEEEEFFMGYRFTYCADCKIDVMGDPTKKELKEMRREAKLRVLKAKKMSYFRQFERGTLSVEGLRTLMNAVEEAMDSTEVDIPLYQLFKLFKKDDAVARKKYRKDIDRWFDATHSELSKIHVPETRSTHFAYAVVSHKAYVISIHVVLAWNILTTGLEAAYSNPSGTGTQMHLVWMCVLVSFSVLFQVLYTVEFFLKIAAFSWMYVFQHGCRTYFMSYWNVLEFVLMVVGCVDLVFNFIYIYDEGFSETYRIFLWLRFFRALRFFYLVQFCGMFSTSLARFIDTQSYYHIAVAYELGKAYVIGEEEILEMLPHIIDNISICEEIRARLEHDRLAVIKLLGIVQKDKPWIAISVKTLHAIRTILNAIQDSIHQLKMSGWVDDSEYGKLLESVEEKRQYLTVSLRFVQPVTPDVLFRQIPWLGDEEQIIEFLYTSVVARHYNVGDVICHQGEMCSGIYVLVSGLLLMTYVPTPGALERLQYVGCLPVIDYMLASGFDKPFRDFIVSGNCIGELCTLTGRPYDCTVSAETHCQVFLLKHRVMKEAFDMSQDPVNGLECRIWKSIAIRVAVPVVLAAASTTSLFNQRIKLSLERSFTPLLKIYKYIEDRHNVIQDIILVEGIIIDYSTGKRYVAPCHVPRAVNRLMFSESSTSGVLSSVQARLLIIPDKDLDEFDVELGESSGAFRIVPRVLHTVRDKSLENLRRSFMQQNREMEDRRRSGIGATDQEVEIVSYQLDGKSKVESLDDN